MVAGLKKCNQMCKAEMMTAYFSDVRQENLGWYTAEHTVKLTVKLTLTNGCSEAY